MWGLILLLLIAAAVAAVIFVPALKGWRTVILGALSTAFGAVVPLLNDIAGYLQGLDWRYYILNSDDHRNWWVLGIVGGLGVLMIIMRFLTRTSVGDK